MENDPTPFLGDEQFREQYGDPPWDIVNRILRTSHLDYEIDRPTHRTIESYVPKLVNVRTKKAVKFAELSSGEKVLMSIALCLFHATDTRELTHFPKVLLFDEIDSPLHPAMTRQFLDAVEGTLVTELGVKVILVTHSPSTIALANSDSIFLMSCDNPRLTKVSKDTALSALLSGVPTLSVRHENRRQVVVESKYDVCYYEEIFRAIRSRLIPDVSVSFIASGNRGGNCDSVYALVQAFNESGNTGVYGIIDWDKGNCSNRNVRVLGEGQRYGIENFVFDPLILLSFVRYERLMSVAEMGMNADETHLDIVSFPANRLQPMVDGILRLVGQQPSDESDQSLVDCHYCNGTILKIPRWYLEMQGHRLEAAIKDAFPALNRFRNEADLKRRVLATVVSDCPGLLPAEFVSLFQFIQTKGSCLEFDCSTESKMGL